MIALAAILIISAYFAYYYWNTYSYWKRKGVVGPTPWPIVGNYGQVLFRLKPEVKLIKEIYDEYPQEKYVGLYIGSRPILLLRDVWLFTHVFGIESENFPTRPVSIAFDQFKKKVFLPAMPTDKAAKNYRKRFTSVTNNTQMAKTMNNIETANKEFLNFLDKLVENNPQQDVANLLQRCYCGLVQKAVFGKNVETFEKDTELQINALRVERLETNELSYVFEAIFPGVAKVFKNIIIAFGNIYVAPCINAAISAINFRKHIKQQESFVDLLLELQKQTNEWQIDDEAMSLHLTTMIVGLISTTCLMTSFLAFALANNSEIQDICYEEINRVLKNTDGKITLEALLEMKYFDIVIEETMRKYGLAYIFQRYSATKYNFPGTDLIVDPGVQVMSSAEAFRMDPKYFPDPDKFIPERFTPENREKIPLGAHTPFGYGPRLCIGKPMAKLMLMMNMAAFLHKFKLEPSALTKDLDYDPSYRVRKPLGRIWVNIISRKQ